MKFIKTCDENHSHIIVDRGNKRVFLKNRKNDLWKEYSTWAGGDLIVDEDLYLTPRWGGALTGSYERAYAFNRTLSINESKEKDAIVDKQSAGYSIAKLEYTPGATNGLRHTLQGFVEYRGGDVIRCKKLPSDAIPVAHIDLVSVAGSTKKFSIRKPESKTLEKLGEIGYRPSDTGEYFFKLLDLGMSHENNLVFALEDVTAKYTKTVELTKTVDQPKTKEAKKPANKAAKKQPTKKEETITMGTNAMTTSTSKPNLGLAEMAGGMGAIFATDAGVRLITRKFAKIALANDRPDIAEMLIKPVTRDLSKFVVPASLLGLAYAFSDAEDEATKNFCLAVIPPLKAAVTASGADVIKHAVVALSGDEEEELNEIKDAIREAKSNGAAKRRAEKVEARSI